MHRYVAQRRHGRDAHDRGRFLWCRLFDAGELHVHRASGADEDRVRPAMVSVDRAAPIRFLRTAYDAADWVAVFLKTYRTGEVAQRVLPVSDAASSHFQAWLRHLNAKGWNVYVSVNAVLPGRSRTRRSIAAVRHVFLEEDRDGPALLAKLRSRGDLPPVSYVLNSSPGPTARLLAGYELRVGLRGV